MTTATLERYGPCRVHRLWHDRESGCPLCLYAEADALPLPEVEKGVKTPGNIPNVTLGQGPDSITATQLGVTCVYLKTSLRSQRLLVPILGPLLEVPRWL